MGSHISESLQRIFLKRVRLTKFGTINRFMKKNFCFNEKHKSKGSVSQLMDDLDLIIEQVEVMVNSIQKGVENVLRKQCRLKTLLLL